MAEELIVEFKTPDSVQRGNFGRYCFVTPICHGNINFSKNSYKIKLVFSNIALLSILMNEQKH